MIKTTQKINSLTSLRFFAALMVISLHVNQQFIFFNFINYFSLQLGVSIFFVLSGFILTYVYPRLEKDDILNFIKARFARIWPAHMAALLLTCLLMHEFVQLYANRFYFFLCAVMVNSWIPLEGFIIKFNQPAWSVSTEFFFYLCFPLFLYNFSKNWYIKLFYTLITVFLIVGICDLLNLPNTNDYAVSKLSLIYYNPWCRLFEFVIGMCTAFIYKHIAHINFPFLFVSFAEISLIILMLLSLAHAHPWHIQIYKPLSTTGSMWMTLSGGSSIFIAAVILVLALQKGIINWILCFPLFVSLGEISYSLYLVHNIFLTYYGAHIANFNHIALPVRCGLYWTITMTTAYLMWRLIEVPCRKYITSIDTKKIKLFLHAINKNKITQAN